MHTEKGIYNNGRFHFLGVMWPLKSCQFLLSTSNQFDPLPPKKIRKRWVLTILLDHFNELFITWKQWPVKTELITLEGLQCQWGKNTSPFEWHQILTLILYSAREFWSDFLINREICDREQGSRDLLKFWFFLSVRLIKTKRTRSMYNSANSRTSGGCLY